MVRLLVGTDTPDTSTSLVAYLTETLHPGDEVVIVNSLPGGESTSEVAVAEGEEALDVLEDGVDRVVGRHQYVRGNEPVEDLLAAGADYDVDEYVIGVRKQSPVGKIVFGSTAQNLLLESDLPVRCVPLVES